MTSSWVRWAESEAAREGGKHGDDVTGSKDLVRRGVVSIHHGKTWEIVRNMEGGLDLRHRAAIRQLEESLVADGVWRQIGLERGEELDLDLHGPGLVEGRGGGDAEPVAGPNARGFVEIIPPGQLGRREAIPPGDAAHRLARLHDVDV